MQDLQLQEPKNAREALKTMDELLSLMQVNRRNHIIISQYTKMLEDSLRELEVLKAPVSGSGK